MKLNRVTLNMMKGKRFFINGDSDVDTEDDETYDEVDVDSDLDEL